MTKDNFIYFTWQCLLMLVCGIVGLIAVFLQPNLPADISVLFAIVFALCIVAALLFLSWIKHKRKQEEEDNLIDSIGKTGYMD